MESAAKKKKNILNYKQSVLFLCSCTMFHFLHSKRDVRKEKKLKSMESHGELSNKRDLKILLKDLKITIKCDFVFLR